MFVVFSILVATGMVWPRQVAAERTEFFEDPVSLTGDQGRYPRFLVLQNEIMIIYQEETRLDEESGEVRISALYSGSGRRWDRRSALVGPFNYSGGTSPLLYSAVATRDDVIYLAVTASAEETLIYRSLDRGRSFDLVHTVRTDRTNVAPYLAEMNDGSITLFVNRNLDGRQQIVYVNSRDGLEWTDTTPLDRDSATGLIFLPRHASVGDKDFVVYQGLNITARSTYQLYIKESTDGGRSWENQRRITTFADTAQTDNADLYDNQRPHLVAHPEDPELYLVWERRFQAGSPQVYLQTFDARGEPTGFIEEVTGRFDTARSPRITFDGTEPVIVWFTSPTGNSRIVLGRPAQFRWQTETISPAVGEASFAEAVYFRDRLHILCQRRGGPRGAAVVYKEPDQSVDAPTLLAENFPAGGRSAAATARVAVRDPPDPSGIRGYAWTWSRDPDAPVPREIMQRVPDRTIVSRAEEEGQWYLRVRATDFAGNWSEPATIGYYLDTTPPGPVVFPPPPVDERGYLASNTFTLGWLPPPDEEHLGGYSVRLDYLGPETRMPGELPQFSVPPRVTTAVPTISRTNAPDGLWVLTVAAVDDVGNVGPPRAVPLRLDKFVPFTRVVGTTVERDLLGRHRLAILGQGFLANGEIRQIVLDRTGEPPWDHEFNLRQDGFALRDDRTITDLLVEEIESGTYRLGLNHTERGMYFAPEPVRFDPRGIIKYGDFRPAYRPGFETVSAPYLRRNTQDVMFLVVIAAAAALILISMTRLVSIGGEIRRLNLEARALVSGRTVEDISGIAERTRRMRVQGFGLRLKFAFFVVLLVVSVVVVVAVSLGRTVLQRQERILVAGLQERIELLLEGQVTGARPALENPQLNLDQFQNLIEQGEAMAEALHVTITGLDAQGNVETIYATSDPVAQSGETINTEIYTVAVSQLEDIITPSVTRMVEELNLRAREEIGEIPAELEELSRQAQQLIVQGAPDEEIARIDSVRVDLLQRGRARLTEIAGPIRSEPAFDPEDLRPDMTTFVFYRPVMDIVAGAGADFRDFYRGTVRVAVTTQPILDEIAATQRELILTTIIVTAVAVGFGILGAYLLATIIVIPITRLVSLVETITATEDKSTLKGTSLNLRSRDELKLLADSINTMTDGLVKAAEADKDLLFGKETQKAFIPLERISDDTKKSSGELDVPGAYFFGYYEGAKGVSGDYFTYQKLSDRYYAMIKCDVAGKGIPAALIMVQVATVFQDYFRGWTEKRPGLDLSSMVVRVNDVVAEQQFKGRFAALTAGILDVQTGAFYTVNAGDNQLHVYRNDSRDVEILSIPGGPASGMFSSEDMPITFPQETRQVASGDVLLLFTDGMEEAKRLLRNSDFSPMVVTQEMIDKEEVPADLGLGHDGEEFTIQRIHDIVRAVQTGGTYRLEKVLNPVEGEVLEFDFRGCSPDGRDLALAIVAAEKVFRLVPDPTAGPTDRVRVDAMVDDFLREHFLQYRTYFAHPARPAESNDGGRGSAAQGDSSGKAPGDEVSPLEGLYRTYTHLREDEQYDDLTILVVRRK